MISIENKTMVGIHKSNDKPIKCQLATACDVLQTLQAVARTLQKKPIIPGFVCDYVYMTL